MKVTIKKPLADRPGANIQAAEQVMSGGAFPNCKKCLRIVLAGRLFKSTGFQQATEHLAKSTVRIGQRAHKPVYPHCCIIGRGGPFH